jgi:hypothetical protein
MGWKDGWMDEIDGWMIIIGELINGYIGGWDGGIDGWEK